jgi:endonuclease/exonuclease/phosphatase family metal-dependent hydrolase
MMHPHHIERWRVSASQRPPLRLALCLILALSAGCAHPVNYGDAAGPRYAGGRFGPARAPDQLRVVSFNVKNAVHVDLAIALLRRNDSLRGADILLLQEMDARGVMEVADSLGMAYVYYPASRSRTTGRDVGNAILSRWPLSEDRKVVLPHLGRIRGTERVAVGATVLVGSRRVRVYSVHLATMVANGPNDRRDQLRTLLADADSLSPVIIGGDFNSETVPALAGEHGYLWPTQRLPHTSGFWTFDHFLLKGVALTDSASFGVVKQVRGASDHRPVWAVLTLTD